jgi:hypothetical protein
MAFIFQDAVYAYEDTDGGQFAVSGEDLNDRGYWYGTNTYYPGDVVKYNTALHRSAGTNADSAPNVDINTDWSILVILRTGNVVGLGSGDSESGGSGPGDGSAECVCPWATSSLYGLVRTTVTSAAPVVYEKEDADGTFIPQVPINGAFRMVTKVGSTELQFWNAVTEKYHTLFPSGPENAIITMWGTGEDE